MVQVRRLDPKVGSRLALFCIHPLNRMNYPNDSEKSPSIRRMLLRFCTKKTKLVLNLYQLCKRVVTNAAMCVRSCVLGDRTSDPIGSDCMYYVIDYRCVCRRHCTERTALLYPLVVLPTNLISLRYDVRRIHAFSWRC